MMKRYLAAASLTVLALTFVTGAALAVPPPAPDPIQDQKAEAIAEVWPMPVEDFLAGNYLERADVVLTRRDWDLASWAIRWATKSQYSHAAMVFTGPQFESGYTNTFVIEAGTAGVDLTNLRDYIADKNSFLAIKRFNGDWFDEAKQSRVRGLLLDEIKAGYNYWAIGQIAQNLWFGVQRSLGGSETVEILEEKDRNAPKVYICSGLVQIGFVQAIIEYIKSDQLPPSTLKEVVFDTLAATRLPDKADWSYFDSEDAKTTAVKFRDRYFNALESVTPEDLAKSENLQWLYFIKDGLVHKVGSYQDASKFIPE